MQASVGLSRPAHVAVLTLVLATGLTATFAVRRRPSLWDPLRWSFAAISATAGMSWYLFRVFGLHQPVTWALPFEICDASLWLTVLSLLWPRQRLLELAYFWGLAGAPIALITPYLIAPLFSFPTLAFLIGHGMIVASILFLLGTGRMRPAPGSWRFALLVLNGFAVFDYLFDRLTGTNYMYLIHKPPIRSLFSLMGPWPWYILGAEVVAAVVFLLLQLPFRHERRSLEVDNYQRPA